MAGITKSDVALFKDFPVASLFIYEDSVVVARTQAGGLVFWMATQEGGCTMSFKGSCSSLEIFEALPVRLKNNRSDVTSDFSTFSLGTDQMLSSWMATGLAGQHDGNAEMFALAEMDDSPLHEQITAFLKTFGRKDEFAEKVRISSDAIRLKRMSSLESRQSANRLSL